VLLTCSSLQLQIYSIRKTAKDDCSQKEKATTFLRRGNNESILGKHCYKHQHDPWVLKKNKIHLAIQVVQDLKLWTWLSGWFPGVCQQERFRRDCGRHLLLVVLPNTLPLLLTTPRLFWELCNHCPYFWFLLCPQE